MKIGKISTFAFSRMKQRGITLDALQHLLSHGHTEMQCDGVRLVYLDCIPPRPVRDGHPKRTLYAVLDAAGEVLMVEKRVRLRGQEKKASVFTMVPTPRGLFRQQSTVQGYRLIR